MKVCIVCQKEVNPASAAKVKEDAIVGLIRSIKQRFGIAKNNELYVCPADLEAHAKRRKDFENNLVFSTLIAALFVLVLVALPLLAGRFDFWGIFSSIVIGALLVVVVVFFRYTPALENPSAAQSLMASAPAAPAAPAPSVESPAAPAIKPVRKGGKTNGRT